MSKGSSDQYEHYLSDALVKAVPGLYKDLAAEVARQHAGNLVRELTNDQEQVVRRFTQRAVLNDWTPEELADRLTRYIGLDTRSANAVENLRQGLIKRGIPKGVARQRSYAYARQLRASRARNIARTELARSVAAAKRALWRDWRDDGLIDQYAVRVWHTSKKEVDCPVCRPMNGQRAALDGLYKNGRHGPPAHPNCQCWETLERGPAVLAKEVP